MDIERVNATLNAAILGLQADEVEGMVEAMASGVTSYSVPSPAGMRSSYRPPSPASMGFAPGRKEKLLKWKKGTIEVATREDGVDKKEKVPGVIKGVWGIHKALSGYGGNVITHTPTGLAFSRDLSQTLAKEVVQVLIEKYPSLLNEKDPDKILAKRLSPREMAQEAQERINRRRAESAAKREAQREKDMLMNPSLLGTKKWKKATFNTSMSVGSKYETKKTLGHIKGAWGVTKDSDGWKVIHLQSGLALVQRMRTKKSCIELVDEMIKEEPSLLFLKAKDISGFTASERRVAQDVARKYRREFGR